MALLDIIKKGTTDYSTVIKIVDSTDGTPETGVVYNTSGIDLWYRRDGATKTSITEASLSALTDAHSDGGFLAISNGDYRLDLPDAAVASGANKVQVGGTVTGMVVIGGTIRLVDYDPDDGVRAGLTALPNAAADAAGGLPISDAGGLDLDTLNSNITAALADTNELQTNQGNWLTATGFSTHSAADVWDVATRVLTAGTNIVLPSGGLANVTAWTVDITGSLSGSVGSVTGAVGSVTGNVGGNVTGSVGSVATGGITAASIAADAITAAKVAADVHQELIELAFTYNATADYAGATAGSLVKEIADNAGGSALTAAAIADAVWEEAIADHSGTTGSTAESLNSASSAGDPWNTALPGAYASGKAGYILGTNLDAAISTVSTYDGSDTSGTTTLLGRLTATRAGYLDNLSAGAVATAAKVLKYFQLLFRKDAAIATDNSTEVTAINADGGSGGGTFANTTDSVEAVRDRGDSAWVTATGFSTLDAAGIRTAVGLGSANLDTQIAALPTATEITADMDANSTKLTAIVADTNELQTNQGNWLTATGFSTHSASDVWAVGTRTLTANTNLNDPTAAAIATAVLTTAMTESYATDGSAATLAQAVYLIQQSLTEASASGTTITIKKLDGSTTAATLTLDDGTNPTSRTRAT